MSEQKLKIAILGLSQNGRDLLDAAEGTGLFQIEAVGDVDPEVAEKIARKYDCAAFDDYRQLVIRPGLDMIIVDAPIHLCDEHIRTALKRKVHILKLGPAALDFEQFAEFIQLAKIHDVRFVVANFARFSPAFTMLKDHIHSEGSQGFHLITAVHNTTGDFDPTRDRWLSDPELAGGGVLLRDCYEIIDLIVQCFGLPHQVYALNTNHAPDMQQRLSITEDSVCLTMKFSDVLTGSLLASRILGPPGQWVTLHGQDKSITVTNDSFTVCDNFGTIIDQKSFDTTEIEMMTDMLKNLAANMRDPQQRPVFGSAQQEVSNMALIESAYLSAKTAMPEEPARILNMANLDISGIWTSAAKRIV